MKTKLPVKRLKMVSRHIFIEKLHSEARNQDPDAIVILDPHLRGCEVGSGSATLVKRTFLIFLPLLLNTENCKRFYSLRLLVGIHQGVAKRCRLSWLINSAQMRGLSQCAHEVQINLGHLTPYLT
jgi:hypothetical protein